MRTTVTFEGNLADDPQVRFTPSGKQITEITVLINQRRQNGDGEWVDTEPIRHVVRAFKTLAENVGESLANGGSGLRARDRHHRGLDRPADR
jgi:single-strand DNA-binding protein